MADIDEDPPEQDLTLQTTAATPDEGTFAEYEEKASQIRDPLAVEERMRVDRRKLERMLQAVDEPGETAEAFFQRVMQQTETTINWPSKLKIGAKSKKDPHIKIAGRAENVRKAKDMVTAVLDTKSNRVTLKMDVSHLEHSHVIGKGGVNIKRVMEETSCHIHFPDSNRSKQFDKSNQVSIAGQPQGVEAARRQIRELLPLTLTCELPVTNQGIPDPGDAPIQSIADRYQVNIAFKPRPRMFTYVTVIRGYVSRSAAVKEATGRLIEHLVGEPAHSVLITIQMDIAPQHHLFMIGRNGMNIKHIMTRTGANIQFPDAESSQRNKSAVFITGTIDSVCLAREQLIGCLPLVLMFDLKDETGTVMNDIVGLAQLMEALDVFISVKPKPKQLSKSVIVKTVERNAHNMYYARVYLLEKDPSSKVEIESPVGTGDFPFSSETSPPLFAQPSLIPLQGGVPQYSSIGNGRIASDKKSGGRVPPGLIHIKQHMMDLSLSTGSSSALSLSSSGVDFPDTPLSLSSSDHSLSTGSLGSVGLHSSPQRAHWPTGPSNMEFLKSNALLREPMRTSVAISPPDADLTDSGLGAEHISPPNSQSCSLSPSHGSPVQLSGHSPSPLCDDGMELISERKDRLSNVVGSCGSMSPDSAFPDKRILSHPYEGLSSLHQGHGAQLQLYPEKHMKLTQCGNIVLESQIDYRDVDYERRRRMASEAMKKPVITQEVRFPTDIWSGMGFSKSMPESAIREQLRRRGKIMKEPDMVTAFEEEETFDFLRQRNQYDPPGIKHAGRNSDQEFSFGPVGTPAYDGSLKPFLQQDNDLVDLLTRIGLAKYATLFEDQEVDLNTFLTLGDRDLKELGVSTFGARKKMLLAIADVQGRPLGSHHIDSSLIVGSSINSGSNKYPYDHTVGSRRDMMSMSGRW